MMIDNYTTKNLVDVNADEFKNHILSLEGKVDFKSENYSETELSMQRDLSIKYHWGHNHDFGTFSIEGKMSDRHLELMADFCTYFDIDFKYFSDKKVFDIGSWTGGTALVLAKLSESVYTIDEVEKYVETTKYLKKSFNIQNLEVGNRSLYDCNVESLSENFDIIYFPGVLYHLSDPLLALRILYNSCKLGGVIFIESAGIDSQHPFCLYEGSQVFKESENQDGQYNRGGWNWFIPSEKAIERMIYAAGFDEIQTVYVPETKRIYAFARKVKNVGITKAGLSVTNIL